MGGQGDREGLVHGRCRGVLGIAGLAGLQCAFARTHQAQRGARDHAGLRGEAAEADGQVGVGAGGVGQRQGLGAQIAQGREIEGDVLDRLADCNLYRAGGLCMVGIGRLGRRHRAAAYGRAGDGVAEQRAVASACRQRQRERTAAAAASDGDRAGVAFGNAGG